MQTVKDARCKCSIIGCGNKRKQKEGLALHIFPKNDALRKLWIRAIGRENWEPNTRSRVCSEHFSESDFNGRYFSGPKLKDTAVPSIFPAHPDHSKRPISKCGPVIKSSSSEETEADPDLSELKECSVVLQRLPIEVPLEEDTIEWEDTSCSPSNTSTEAPGGGPSSKSDTMPSLLRCCVPGCKTLKRKVVVGVTYHKFPDDPLKRIEWFNAIKNTDVNINNCDEVSICSSHFQPRDFVASKGVLKRRTLNPRAVPCVDLPKKNFKLLADTISVSSDGSYSSPCSPLESRPEPSGSVGDQPVTSDAQNKPPSVSRLGGDPHKPETVVAGARSRNDDHCYYYAGGKPIVQKINEDPSKTLPTPVLPTTKTVPAPQPYTVGTSSAGTTVPAIAVKHNQMLYIYPAQLAPIKSPSSGPSNVPAKTTANILVGPLSSTISAGKVFTCSIPPRTTVPVSTAPNSLEVPKISEAPANIETAHTGWTGLKTYSPSIKSRQQVSLNMHNYGSKPSTPSRASGAVIPNEQPPIIPSWFTYSKHTQTDFKQPIDEMKQKLIEFERRTVQLEYKLAQAKLKQAETSKKRHAAQRERLRLAKSVAKYKETIESRKKEIEVLQFKNKQLELELDKMKPKPPKPRPVKVYMPSDMVGAGNSNLELGQGKPFKDGKIITFELQPEVQPNNAEGGRIPTCLTRPKHKKQKLLPSPKIWNTSPAPPIKKPCLPSTSKVFNESGPLNVEISTKADDGTIVYNLKPAAKVQLKPTSPPKSVPVQIDESEFRAIETLTDEGDIAYHLLRSPQKTFTTPRKDFTQNAGYQINEDLKAVEVILSLDEVMEE